MRLCKSREYGTLIFKNCAVSEVTDGTYVGSFEETYNISIYFFVQIFFEVTAETWPHCAHIKGAGNIQIL